MRWAVRVLLTLILLLGLYFAQQQWRYQHAVAQKQLQRATAIWPANDEGWYLLAAQNQFSNFAASARAAQHATQVNPNNWQDWAMLAEAQIAMGNMSAARQTERSMAERANVFSAHWQYANLLFVSGDTAGFWPQASQALSFAPTDQIDAALNQMWRFAQGDTNQFNAAILTAVRRATDSAQASRIALAVTEFYIDHKQVDAVAPWWQQAIHDPKASHKELTFVGGEYLAKLADAGENNAALQLWQNGRRKGLFAATAGPTATNLVASADHGALAWVLCTTCGPWAADNYGTLSFAFHGNQADTVVLAHQRMLLAPQYSYRLSYQQTVSSGTIGGGPTTDSGVQVEITGSHGNVLQAGTGTFTTPADPDAYTLQVVYERPQGQVPLSGTVTLDAVKIVAVQP